MAGRKVFTAGEVLQAADVNDYLMDQSVMVFAGTAARGSAIPSPTEGMASYRTDDDAFEIYDGSAWSAVAGGKILQVVSTTKTDTFSASSSSFTDVTGLSATITPSATANKIMVILSSNISGDNNGVRIFARMVRDSTAIYVGTSVGSRVAAGFQGFINTSTGTQKYGMESVSMTVLDSPSSTSALTYKMQVSATSGAVNVNKNGEDADSNLHGRTASTITLMEVAG